MPRTEWGQALGDAYKVSRQQFLDLTVNVESNAPLQDLHGNRCVRMVLVHLTTSP